MIAETLDSGLGPMTMADLIEKLGFPVASFVIMVLLLLYIMKKDEKRQCKSDERYEGLVNKFIETTKEISGQNNFALREMTEELKSVTLNLEKNIEKTEQTKEKVEEVEEKVSTSIIKKDQIIEYIKERCG